uniref:Intraflagellar transport protein 46 homolog n=1 Tax=Simocephalus serrulatus TaxID=117539 RepID=A0A4Y7NPI5_9CRUS|nr:EOG090X0FP3 [Simocephalus serrulatus]
MNLVCSFHVAVLSSPWRRFDLCSSRPSRFTSLVTGVLQLLCQELNWLNNDTRLREEFSQNAFKGGRKGRLAYRPQILEMETKLKPFLPDFIPAVGDPDGFLKIDRPDGNAELLGLMVIDEPSLNQSDPSVLDLRLRSIYKRSSAKTIVARTVEDGNKSKAIDKWIKDINELHRSKPLPTVVYHKSLPDIDTLLQEWNPEVEEVLGEESAVLPPNLDCDLSSYIDIACGLLDIPVYPGNRIHSLHLLLTLYSEMGRLQK